MADASLIEPLAPVRHTKFEDGYAILTGSSFVVLGLVLLKSAGLATGGVAGLALLASNFSTFPPGVLFTLLNIPFFLFAAEAMGRAAVTKAIVANLIIALFALIAPVAFHVQQVSGLFAAMFGGTIIGAGILLLARHQVGVGGIGILALALHERHGWNVGRILLVADTLILSAALPVLGLDLTLFAVSVLGAIAVSAVLIVFHKPGRYTGY